MRQIRTRETVRLRNLKAMVICCRLPADFTDMVLDTSIRTTSSSTMISKRSSRPITQFAARLTALSGSSSMTYES
jgi:hypothetical protein